MHVCSSPCSEHGAKAQPWASERARRPATSVPWRRRRAATATAMAGGGRRAAVVGGGRGGGGSSMYSAVHQKTCMPRPGLMNASAAASMQQHGRHGGPAQGKRLARADWLAAGLHSSPPGLASISRVLCLPFPFPLPFTPSTSSCTRRGLARHAPAPPIPP